MVLSQELAHALSAADLSGVRAALIGYLDADSTGDAVSVADEAAKRLQLQGIELFEPDDGRDVVSGASGNDALLNIKAALRRNFSREKIVKGKELKCAENEKVKPAAPAVKPVPVATASMVKPVAIPETPIHSGGSPVSEKSSPSFAVGTKKAEPVSDELNRAISLADVSMVRAILIGYFDADSTGDAVSVADEAAKRLQLQGIELFEPDDGRDVVSGASGNDALLNIKAALRRNFSREKIKKGKELKCAGNEKVKSAAPASRPVPAVKPASVVESAPAAPAARHAAIPATPCSSNSRVSEKPSQSFAEGKEKTEPVSDELNRAISLADVSMVRAILIGYLDADSTGDAVSVADEAAKRLQLQGIELFEPDDGRDVVSGASGNDALLNIKAALRRNFSREKIKKGKELKCAGNEKVKSAAPASRPVPAVKPASVVESTPAAKPTPAVEPPHAAKPTPAVESAPAAKPNPEVRHGPASVTLNPPGQSAREKLSTQNARPKGVPMVVKDKGPLEILLGQIGRFFDRLFDRLFHMLDN